jgi:hypothetical protein
MVVVASSLPAQRIAPCSDAVTTASCAAGLSKEEVLSEGVHVLAAFEQLVNFVHSNTLPGQTPVIVGHQGLELLFKHVEQCLQRAQQQQQGHLGTVAAAQV